MIEVLKNLEALSRKFEEYQRNTIPLCAAENVMSDFCKLPLNAGFQERYIMGSAYEYTTDGNFIGSEYLLPFYHLLDKQCHTLFKSKYADARTLTGMNCLTTILMSISKYGDNVMILGSAYGGHASVKGICERLSLNVFDAPYILENYDLDYDAANAMIREHNIKFVLPAPSDILFPLDLTKITSPDVIILNDASQLLGLIGAGVHENLLSKMPNMIMFGGTHKTLPGPAHGIALTNNEELFRIIDKGINPKYLRNTQMHQIVSLLFCLIEAEQYGHDYQANIVRISNVLAGYLENRGFTVAKKDGRYSMTHQVFIECSREKMNTIYNNAIASGVTLNTKRKELFHGGYGIRLGTQEIARYAWDDSALENIAEIIHFLSFDRLNTERVDVLKKRMPEKAVHYTFSQETINELKSLIV